MHSQIKGRIYFMVILGIITCLLGVFFLYSVIHWNNFGKNIFSAPKWMILMCACFLLLVSWLSLIYQTKKFLRISNIIKKSLNIEEWDVRIYSKESGDSTHWYIERLIKTPIHYLIDPLKNIKEKPGHIDLLLVFFSE